MNSRNRKQICETLYLFLLLSSCLQAGQSLSVYIENDTQKLQPNHKSDRHYTSGVKVVYGFEPEWEWLKDFAGWDFPFFPVGSEPAQTAAGIFFGQNIYTPDYPDEPERRDPEDMKFAGWLYTGMFIQRAAGDVMDHVELNVGIIGPSAHGEQLQNCTHELLNGEVAIGWEDQIEDEPAVDFSWMRRKRLTEQMSLAKTDLIAEYGFTAGSVHRHLQAGIIGRYAICNLPADFGPGRLSLPAGVLGRSKSMERSAYLFARLAGRAVEHNRFLTGLDEEPFVGELQLGFVYQYKWMEIGYSQTFLTKEFDEQSGSDSFGAVNLSLYF